MPYSTYSLPTLFAACRCAASHVAELEEGMNGSEEFFWQIYYDLIRCAVFPRALFLARLRTIFKNLDLSVSSSDMQGPSPQQYAL